MLAADKDLNFNIYNSSKFSLGLVFIIPAILLTLARIYDFLFEFLILMICIVCIIEIFIAPKIMKSISDTLKRNKHSNRENLVNQKLS
ncbi:MAG: hypothetical protein O9294_16215 [Cytophagales bacterium]|nr:hypothetical protein [Cytophagales bacterium]